MAQSIRISDALYQLALAHSAAMGRSLAQQVDYWARLGVALEEAGMTVEQALVLVGAQAGATRVPPRSRVPHRQDTASARGAAPVQHSIDRLAQEVAAGRRKASTLFAIPEGLARRARVTFPADTPRAAKGW